MSRKLSQLKFTEREYRNPFREERFPNYPNRSNYESADDETFNDHMEREYYFKPAIDDFLQSGPSSKLVIVLVNFSIIGIAEKKGQLLPGEMALTAFSLECGIVDNCVMYTYHSGRSAVFKNAQIMATLEKVDLPPRPPHLQGSNYNDVVRILQLFRKKHEYHSNSDNTSRPALLFCRRSEYGTVTKCLEYLFEKKGDPFGYHVFPLEYFVAQISANLRKCLIPNISTCLVEVDSPLENKNYLSEEFSEDLLNSEEFSGYSSIACTYHCGNIKGLLYCPLKIVNEHAYNILSAMADRKFAVAGTHYPSVHDEKNEILNRQQMLQEWKAVSQTPLAFLTRINGKNNVESEPVEPVRDTKYQSLQELIDYRNNLKESLKEDVDQLLSISEDGRMIFSSFASKQNAKQSQTSRTQLHFTQTATIPPNSFTCNNPQHQMPLQNVQNYNVLAQTSECISNTYQCFATKSGWQSSTVNPPGLQGALSYQKLVQNIVQQVVKRLPGPTPSCFHDNSRPIRNCHLQNSNWGHQRNCSSSCSQTLFTFTFPHQFPMTFPGPPTHVATNGEQRLMDTNSQNKNGRLSILNQNFQENSHNLCNLNDGERR